MTEYRNRVAFTLAEYAVIVAARGFCGMGSSLCVGHVPLEPRLISLEVGNARDPRGSRAAFSWK